MTAAAAETLSIAAHKPGRYVLGTYRNLLLMYWISEGQLDAVRNLDSVYQELLQRNKHGGSAIHLIKANAGLPGPEARKALSASMQRWAHELGCVVLVLQGAGFWASALQSAITGVRMLVPMGEFLLRFVREPSELSDWFVREHEQRTGERIDEAVLLKLVAQLSQTGEQ